MATARGVGEVARLVSAAWGRARGLAGTAIAHWGLVLVAVIEQKGEMEGF
jgi:hypothetical protein